MQADAYLGLDLGTSAVKALLLDDTDAVVAEVSAQLDVSRPRPLWSEQDPDAWWRAAGEAVAALRARVDGGLSAVRGIGLSGQMHGATLLDASDRPLRPAILWNDGRSAAECVALEQAVPESRKITGNLAMPGFTAPKLLWVQRHEPEVTERGRPTFVVEASEACVPPDRVGDFEVYEVRRVKCETRYE